MGNLVARAGSELVSVMKDSVAWQLNLHPKKHKYQVKVTSYSVKWALTRWFCWTKESGMTLWRPTVHRRHLGQVEKTSTNTSPCRQSCTKQHLDIRNRSRHRKKILIKHQAGPSITMISVDALSRAPINSGSCRQGWLS